MTDPRRQSFTPYLRRLADTLALKDWTVILKDEAPSDPDALASIVTTYGRKRATIRLGDAFLDETPESQRATLVHELIHCHLDSAWEIAYQALPSDVKPVFRRMGEIAVDGLADGVASLFPLSDSE